MNGFVKSSTVIAILLLSATFAYAGDLKAVNQGGTNMHPDGKSNALNHATNDTARAAIGESMAREEADKLRKLRPVK